MSRNRIILLLLLALCVAVVYAWVATPRQRRISTSQERSAAVNISVQQTDISAATDVIDLNFFGTQISSYQDPQKNLFGPLYLPSKKVNKPPPPPPPPKVKQAIPRPKVIEPIKVKPRGPGPIQPLNVLGHLNNGGDMTVFLSSANGVIFLVKLGDVFADGLEVAKITNKEVYIEKKNTGQKATLRLGEAKSQRLPTVNIKSGRPKSTFQAPAVKEKKTSADKAKIPVPNKFIQPGEN